MGPHHGVGITALDRGGPAECGDEVLVDHDRAHAALRSSRCNKRGTRPVDPEAPRWPELVDWMSRRPAVFVDAGTGTPAAGLLQGDVRTLLVTRACYVGLQRVVATQCRPDGVVLVCEPGRSLRGTDVERSVGAPVVASVSVDVAVSRAVDAGLLVARVPRLLQRELRSAA